MIELLRLNNVTIINPKMIVQITVENLNNLRRERRQHYQTAEQRERLNDKFWEVSVYLRSGNDGYNPQRYTQRFKTEQEAQKWITEKFGAVIVNHL
uniref:Uncharacterized protein n=1 Tax=Marseillevirus LCMAC202 TaxID=2506606 RepID=A0A481YWM6_9VIRU|nr:MAG: hypothetical protein LCMAC202_00090 [Marseillevirus LCMAC202]